MIQPIELKVSLPVLVAGGVWSTTTEVWSVLEASRQGNLDKIVELTKRCPELAYAQYNYTPPIHFAVREGHMDLVKYLLDQEAYDPTYKIYPFLDSLVVIAQDRGYIDIGKMLEIFNNNPYSQRLLGDDGEIRYHRSPLQQQFEHAVDKGDLNQTEQILKDNPELANDPTYFWSEGILMRPSKVGNFGLIELLLRYGAQFPLVSKWSRFYYFERLECASFILDHGMSPNHMSWHHVTILHDMAQKGDLPTARLLIDHGAMINPMDEEYSSTPLGFAARWGHVEMVKFLLENGADPNLSGAVWSTPLTWARKKGFKEIEYILINYGASI